ncbi:MAG: O-antigen ligase family protein [Phycisphaerae bacterium]
MPLRSLLFLGLFGASCLLALAMPIFGVGGYMAHYIIGPERQWWAGAVSHYGLRYSYMLALATAVGFLFSFSRLRYGAKLLHRGEILIILFLGLVWISTMTSPTSVNRYTTVDHPSMKLTKVVIFLLMMTHIATTRRKLDALLWVILISAFILGTQAYNTPRSQFVRGRLEGVGGADFGDSNRLVSFLVPLLPLMGVMFMRSRWPGRIALLFPAAFVANTIILCRSRGAMVGAAVAGAAALLFSPRRYRKHIAGGLLVALLGGWYLSDPQFLKRASTIIVDEGEQRDASAESRIEIWKATMQMLKSNPLGVGVGNFYQRIGSYAREHQGRDAHNTFVRCVGELGIPGLIVFCLVLGYAVRTCWQLMQIGKRLPEPHGDQVTWTAYGFLICLIANIACGMTTTLLYQESLWWFIAMPIALRRVTENIREDLREPQPAVALTPPKPQRTPAPAGALSMEE